MKPRIKSNEVKKKTYTGELTRKPEYRACIVLIEVEHVICKINEIENSLLPKESSSLDHK